MKSDAIKWTGSIGRARTYFFDADTGEELLSGADMGAFCAGIYNGRRYFGTHLGFMIVDSAMMYRQITAANFPGHRVIVKQWEPGAGGKGHSTWSLLVDRAKGWAGNEVSHKIASESPTGAVPRVEYDVMRHVRAMPRKAA